MTQAERREVRDDLKDTIEEIDADLVGMREELAEVRDRIAAAVARRIAALNAMRALRVSR